MGISYTEKETQTTVQDYFRVYKLYQSKFVNWTGLAKDTGDPLSEIIAKELSKPPYIDLIKHIADNAPVRRSSYKQKHDGKLDKKDVVNEKRLAIALFNANKKASFESKPFGRIIDYQVPLKDVRTDKVGEIDLIAYKPGELTLIELKCVDSKDTFLHAVLEIFTYFMIVRKSRNKLLEDYCLSTETKLIPAILIHSESDAAKTAKGIQEKSKKYRYQFQLVEELKKIMESPLQVYFHDYNDVTICEYPKFKKPRLIRCVE